MIYDMLDVFKRKYAQEGDKLILDNYLLKDGLYIKINKDRSLEYFIFVNDKKQDRKENCFKDLHGNIQRDLYDWFRERDYYSGYLNSNKSFYDKKIHNVNYLSFFVKVDSFISEDPKKLLSPGAIKGQYLSLLNYRRFIKKEEKEILKSYRSHLDRCSRKKDVVLKYRTLETNIQKIVDVATQNSVKNYIKVFFDEELEKYKTESAIYYAIKIFNDISHSKKIENKVFGLSDSNMGLNSKKPYLEQKTRKVTSPFLLLDSDALLTKKFFDWLRFQDLKNKSPLGHEFFIHRDYREKDLVLGFDHLPREIDRLDEPILIKNYLHVKGKDDDELKELWQLEKIVDDIFYNKQLIFNYFNDDIKVSSFLSKELQNVLYVTKFAMINYFKKYDNREFYQVLKKYSDSFAINHLRSGYDKKAAECLNLKFSLLVHQGETVMDIQNIQNKIIEKLNTSNYDELDSEEFFYLSGQVTKYLLTQSKSGKKGADMLEPFLRAKSVEKLKNEIKFTFFKYKHEIGLNQTKFNNALALITAYDEKKEFNMDSFLVGVLSQNIFYMKRED